MKRLIKKINPVKLYGGVFASAFAAILIAGEPIEGPVMYEFSGPDLATRNHSAMQINTKIIKEELERVKQLSCMSVTIFGESRNQSQLGQELVAEVIMNRVRSSRYPNTVCEVVHQKKQFSMYNLTKDKKINQNMKATNKAFSNPPSDEVLMAIFVANKVMDPSYVPKLPNYSLHYHSGGVNPSWAGKMNKYVEVDSHIFYEN